MIAPYQPYLDWVATQQEAMVALLRNWAEINSGSYNLDGVRRMRMALTEAFSVLGATQEVIPLAAIEQVNSKGEVIEVPMAEALRLTKRPEAPIQVLLVAHMDTVFGADHPFQHCVMRSDTVMNGPGVADLKGGIVVMLHALMALEKSPWREQIGWQILFNPDEEIGSVASDPLLKESAKNKQLGLVYEPALADGTLAGARKGSGNFSITVHGRSAHAGRNPEDGRNAIAALAEITQAVYALNGQREGVTFNPGKLEGGGALNVVPDLAILRFNVRIMHADDAAWVSAQLEEILDKTNKKEGFSALLHGRFTRLPKPMAPEIAALFTLVQECGAQLNIPLGVKPSGGCCDGNNLWVYGLPNVDTLGVRGAAIHSDNEIIHLESLAERAKLSALLLMRLANEGVSLLK